MLAGLEWLGSFKWYSIKVSTVVGDSQLALHLVSEKWNAKKAHLKVVRDRSREAVMNAAAHVEFAWVPRERNALADSLATTSAAR